MPYQQDFRGVFYVRNVPDIRFEDGMFVVCHRIGSSQFEFAMRPNIFLKALRKSTQLASEFHGRDEVFVLGEREG